MRCFLNVASLLQSRMSIGNEFQADGAETAKALSVNRRRVRGVLKSPLDLERSRLSVHGLHSLHKYNGTVPCSVGWSAAAVCSTSRSMCSMNRDFAAISSAGLLVH